MTLRESNDPQLREKLSRGTIPFDMVGVCLAVIAIVLLYYFVPTTPVRFLVSVPLLLFLPGYVLIGILFPRRTQSPQESQTSGQHSGHWFVATRKPDRVTPTERIALSFGLSVAVVPLLGLLLEALPVDAFDGSIFPTLVGGVAIGALIASIRRLRIPADERFRLPIETVRADIVATVSGTPSWSERIATIVLVATVLVAMFSVGYVFAVPQHGEQFTDLRVMTESVDGELTLGNYPDEIDVGESTELIIGIDNMEGQQQAYTVVVTAEQIIQNDGSVTTVDAAELDRFEVTLNDGQQRLQPQTITPESSGEIRINYYLYQGSAPSNPTAESAYRHVHFTTSAVNGGTPIDGNATAGDGELDIDGETSSAEAETAEVSRNPPSLTGDR